MAQPSSPSTAPVETLLRAGLVALVAWGGSCTLADLSGTRCNADGTCGGGLLCIDTVCRYPTDAGQPPLDGGSGGGTDGGGGPPTCAATPSFLSGAPVSTTLTGLGPDFIAIGVLTGSEPALVAAGKNDTVLSVRSLAGSTGNITTLSAPPHALAVADVFGRGRGLVLVSQADSTKPLAIFQFDSNLVPELQSGAAFPTLVIPGVNPAYDALAAADLLEDQALEVVAATPAGHNSQVSLVYSSTLLDGGSASALRSINPIDASYLGMATGHFVDLSRRQVILVYSDGVHLFGTPSTSKDALTSPTPTNPIPAPSLSPAFAAVDINGDCRDELIVMTTSSSAAPVVFYSTDGGSLTWATVSWVTGQPAPSGAPRRLGTLGMTAAGVEFAVLVGNQVHSMTLHPDGGARWGGLLPIPVDGGTLRSLATYRPADGGGYVAAGYQDSQTSVGGVHLLSYH